MYEHQMHSSAPGQPLERMNEFPVFMNITQNTSNTSQYNKATISDVTRFLDTLHVGIC